MVGAINTLGHRRKVEITTHDDFLRIRSGFASDGRINGQANCSLCERKDSGNGLITFAQFAADSQLVIGGGSPNIPIGTASLRAPSVCQITLVLVISDVGLAFVDLTFTTIIGYISDGILECSVGLTIRVGDGDSDSDILTNASELYIRTCTICSRNAVLHRHCAGDYGSTRCNTSNIDCTIRAVRRDCCICRSTTRPTVSRSGIGNCILGARYLDLSRLVKSR